MSKLEIYRDDPFYLIERDGTYCIHGMWEGKRVRKGCRTKNHLSQTRQ